MSETSFDPFDLPSDFNPLGNECAPAAQSTDTRHGKPPRRQRATTPQHPPPERPSPERPTAECPAAERPRNARLAHLLPEAEPPAPASPGDTGALAAETATTARLEALEDEIAILTARLDSLQTTLDQARDHHRDHLLRAVATLIDDRLSRR